MIPGIYMVLILISITRVKNKDRLVTFHRFVYFTSEPMRHFRRFLSLPTLPLKTLPRSARLNSTARLACAAIILALIPALGAHAHPHVFISSRVAVDFDADSLSRVSVEWTFDELFSQMIIADYDGGKKGSFTEAEAVALKKGAFDNLRNYHYFLALSSRQGMALPPVKAFKPSIREGKLVYAFDLPLALPIAPAKRELRITIYDDTYYVAFDKMSPADVECARQTRSRPPSRSRRPR